jgi:tetratricopeptide (TPR) repeat protein
MQETVEEANRTFHRADYQGAVKCYNKALRLCSSFSADVAFDRVRFEAIANSGLSAALGRQGKHLESFAAANKALAFFDQTDKLDDVEVGKYLTAQVNQGTALAALGCFPAALEALHRAKTIFNDKGLDSTKNAQWLQLVDGNIAAINEQIKKQQM